MLTILTDFYDCPNTCKYKTKHSGTNNLPSLFITMLAATTPTSLSNSLPASSIGDGFTSRVLFVWAEGRKRKVAIPKKTRDDEKLEDGLKKDLYAISRMSGTFTMTPQVEEWWISWYNKYEFQDESRLCKDNSFNGWYSRKPSMILRVAMLLSASRSNDMIIEMIDLQKAIKEIEDVERMMGQAFRAVGKSLVSGEVETVVQIVKERKAISEKQLLSMIWRDVDARMFDNVTATAIKRGEIRRDYKSPTGEKGSVWYYSTS